MEKLALIFQFIMDILTLGLNYKIRRDQAKKGGRRKDDPENQPTPIRKDQTHKRKRV